MVKKAIVTAMAVISLFTLMGCNNRAEVDTLSPAQAAELKPMPQVGAACCRVLIAKESKPLCSSKKMDLGDE